MPLMKTGVPIRKCRHHLAGSFDGMLSCVLDGSVLYLLYSCGEIEAEGVSSFIKKIELNACDGDESRVDRLCIRHHAEAGWRLIFLDERNLVVHGDHPEVIALHDLRPIYAEDARRLCAQWQPEGRVFFYKGKVHRTFGFNAPECGVDIIDVQVGEVVEHLEVDVGFFKPPRNGVLFGKKANGNFAVYSLEVKSYLFELSCDGYQFMSSSKLVSAVHVDDRIYALLGDTVVVLDLKSRCVVREINYMKFPMVQEFIETYATQENDAYASGISATADGVVLWAGTSGGYVLYLDVSREDAFLWMKTSHYAMTAVNPEGDIVFGIEERRPKAWDKYTGEQIWEATAGTIANTIHVGDQWLVYSQPAGHIQCFHWKKPYTSPHRPQP